MNDKPNQKPAGNPAPAKPAESAEASPQTMTATEAMGLPVVPLTEDRWQLKEHKNPGHWICVPADVTPEQLLQPSFWANVARKLAGSTTVEVHWDDASQFATVYVLATGRNWASVSLIAHHKLDKPKLPQSSNDYVISFNGPVDKFRIVRVSDRAVIRAGLASELDARKWLDEYLRKLAA